MSNPDPARALPRRSQSFALPVLFLCHILNPESSPLVRRWLRLLAAVALAFAPFSMVPTATAQVPALKDVFDGYFKVGAAVSRPTFSDPVRKANLLKNYNAITPDNELKPDSLLGTTPRIGTDGFPTLNFTNADVYAQFAQDNGLALRGHTLVWYSQTPAWFFHVNYATSGNNFVDRATMLARMQNYIQQVVTHFDTKFPGVIYAWDVVNEAAADDNYGMRGSTPTSGTSMWYKVIGPDYVQQAFAFARQYAAPGVLLFYNDYNENGPAKRQSIIDMLTPVLAAGNVDGIGLQCHHHINTNIYGVEESTRIYAKLFKHIDITELDCQITLTPITEIGYLQQATWYHDFFEALKAMRRDGVPIDHVIFWGENDAISWKASAQPLLYDASWNPKQAFGAIVGERAGVKCEVRNFNAFPGTPVAGDESIWNARNGFPIGRLGTYKAVYDGDFVYFQTSTSPEAEIEATIGGQTTYAVADSAGVARFQAPRGGISVGTAVPFDIGILTDGAANAWNSYYYNGTNLETTNYKGTITLATAATVPPSAAVVCNDTLLAGQVNPTITLTAQSPFGFQQSARGSSPFLLDPVRCFSVDAGVTGLTFSGISVNTAGTQATLSFTGTVNPGTLSVIANAEHLLQRAQGIRMSNTMFLDILSPFTLTRGGFLLNRRTNQITQQVTLTNVSAHPVTGPVYLVLDALSSNTALVNATGTTSGGSPYLASIGNLAPGASVTLVLTFTNPASGGITYNPLTPTSP